MGGVNFHGVHFCTIVSRRDLARARVLVGSLAEHHPSVPVTVAVLDGGSETTDPIDGARLVDAGDLTPRLGFLAVANPPAALHAAVLPHLLGVVLEDAPVAVYLACAMRILAPLVELATTLEQHDVVLAARVREDHGGAFGDDRGGAFSEGLIGMRPGTTASTVLAAWPSYFANSSEDPVRSWFERVPALDAGVGILRDRGYVVDAWSGGELEWRGEAERPELDGRPARLVDFTELDPHDPDRFFEGDDRARLSSAVPLAELARRHAADLLAAGYDADIDRGIPFEGFDDGVRLTPTLRGLFVDAVQAGGIADSPLTQDGRDAFYRYLNEPAESGAPLGLTRAHMAIWLRRPDLQAGYPYLDGPDGPGYAGWLIVHGPEQEGLAAPLLPPPPAELAEHGDERRKQLDPAWGVNVVGFFNAESGLGEAARLLLTGLDAGGVAALPVQGRLRPPHRQDEAHSYVGLEDAVFPVNVMCMTGDAIPVLAREAGRTFFDGRYNVAFWWWELSEFPAGWEHAFEYLDEVWVGSQHISDAIAPASPVPVVKMTMPVSLPRVPCHTREELGFPGDGFLFIFVHDYHSVARRKNAIGVIEAFRSAFEPGSGARLVVKSINAGHHRHEHERVLFAARDHPDITIVDQYVSAGVKNAMIAACDCYVSLHRSEGFGLTVAEAMLLGKPVIATRYGGTLEFTTEANSYLVDWTPVEVGEGAAPYRSHATWAEPDLEHAAELMRSVFNDPDVARARGELARAEIAARHSPAVAGAAMERRLQLIRDRVPKAMAPQLNPSALPPSFDVAKLEEAIRAEPLAEARGILAPVKRLARRAGQRWLRGVIGQQRRIGWASLETLLQLDERMRVVATTADEHQRAEHAETLAALRAVRAELADARTALADLERRLEARRPGGVGEALGSATDRPTRTR